MSPRGVSKGRCCCWESQAWRHTVTGDARAKGPSGTLHVHLKQGSVLSVSHASQQVLGSGVGGGEAVERAPLPSLCLLSA